MHARALAPSYVFPAQDLVGEVGAQLMFFRADARDIKKRLEALIERDYAERDEVDRNSIKYVA